MKNILNKKLDERLEKIEGLTWLPWIGNDFALSKHRLLMVGESHYLKEADDEAYLKSAKERMKLEEFTRHCIYESAINNQWYLSTFANIDRVLFETNNVKEMKIAWRYISFYNFIQNFMNYAYKERPQESKFIKGWEVFIDLIKIIEPTVCIFSGVQASYTFDKSMNIMGVEYSKVERLDKIGNTYARKAKLFNNGKTINIHFIQHPSKFFSWRKWNKYLSEQEPELFRFLIRNK